MKLSRALRSLGAAVLAAAFLLLPVAATSQTPVTGTDVVYESFTQTAVGQTQYLSLVGQNTCTVTFTQVGTGASITVQGIADSPNAVTQTPATVTGIGTSGVISAPAVNTQFGGQITPQAVTGIRLNFTALTSGTYAGSLVCTRAGGPTAVTATLSGTSSVNVAQLAGSTLVSTAGMPIMYYGKPNSVGQPCWGVSTVTGTLIPSARTTLALTASTNVQAVALVASTIVHVCAIEITGALTTGADIGVAYGTGAVCATGTVTFANYYIGVGNEAFATGNGAQDLYAMPSANALCFFPGAFVGTLYVNLDYAQY